MKDIKIIPEEKELLRRLMEDDEACKHWDFFEGLDLDNIPPPEFFMRGEPDPPKGMEADDKAGRE